MSTITLLHTPPPETYRSQIQQLVVDAVSDLSLTAIVPSNPLYQLYQYGVGYEVHLYLEAMGRTDGVSAELILALDAEDPEKLLGFVLYLPAQDDPEACTLPYMAVREGYRRQGVARAMLERLRARRPHIELACALGKVPCFEALGFQVLAARGAHVSMNTRAHASAGLVALVDVAPIYASVEVRQIHTYLLAQHGRKAMLEAEKKRDRQLDQMTRQVQAFIQQRLGPP